MDSLSGATSPVRAGLLWRNSAGCRPPGFQVILWPLDAVPFSGGRHSIPPRETPVMQDHYIPRTKIVCTLGPASSSETVIRKMMRAGMDVARLNFSHGTPQEQVRRIDLVRHLNAKYRRRIGLLGDLQGHRIRVDIMSSSFPLWDRNLNTGNDTATDTEMRRADQVIYHDGVRASRITLPVSATLNH